MALVADDTWERPPSQHYLLTAMLDNPTAVCLTPTGVERVFRGAGFQIEGTKSMLPRITMLTRANKPA